MHTSHFQHAHKSFSTCTFNIHISHFQHAHKSLLTRTQVTFNTHASHFQHAHKSLSTCTQITFNTHASHFQHTHKSLSTCTQITFNTHASHFQHTHKSLSTCTQVTFNMHTSHFQHTELLAGESGWSIYIPCNPLGTIQKFVILQHLHFYLTEKEGHVWYNANDVASGSPFPKVSHSCTTSYLRVTCCVRLQANS